MQQKKWQTIDEIINSFKHYGLGDIIYNKPRPIAAFILSICFIDQISGFRYGNDIDEAKRPEHFFIYYMPAYKGINLFHKARHSLVHNYSSRGFFDIDKEGYENVAHDTINGTIYINTNVFISHLESAFEKVCKDFLENKSITEIAEKWSIEYPVLVYTKR